MNGPDKSIRVFNKVTLLLLLSLLFGVSAFAADGDLDATFDAPDVSGTVRAITVQPDGKILVGGSFGPSFGGAKLNANGSIDPAFDRFGAEFRRFLVLPNNQVLVAGTVEDNRFSPSKFYQLTRRSAFNGVDNVFAGLELTANPNFSPLVYDLALQTDGKIIVVGAFASANGTAHVNIVRLQSNGVVDATFNPIVAPNSSGIRRVFIQPDGKILIGGQITQVNGVARDRIARLNADGTLDTTFVPALLTSSPAGTVGFDDMALQPDGKLVVSAFNLGGYLRRLNSDGSLDATFASTQPSTAYRTLTIALQADGKIVVGIQSNTSAGGIRRLNADGTTDSSFNAVVETNIEGPAKIVIQPDGKILVAATVSKVNGVSVSRNIIRLNNALAAPTPTPTPTPLGTVQFSAATYDAGEGNGGGGTNGTTYGEVNSVESALAAAAGGSTLINITRTDTTQAASVDYATANGTASSRTDYAAAFGTLRFAVGESTKTILIPITDDAFLESPETFSLSLSNPVGVLLGTPATATVTITSNDAADAPSPVKDASFNVDFFVRQQYADFLNREADADGLAFWTSQITECETRPVAERQGCREVRRINVSAAFFLSIEFQETGYFAYRFNQAAFNTGEHLALRDFISDKSTVSRGVVVGQANYQQQLEQNKQLFADEFVKRATFLALYPATLTAAQFVDALNVNTNGSLSTTERNDLVTRLGNNQLTRAQALRAVVDDADFSARESNRAFVLMEYFGYLRRAPNETPDADFSGYNFWLSKLNSFNGDYVRAEMVKAFINANEYQNRFGQ